MFRVLQTLPNTGFAGGECKAAAAASFYSQQVNPINVELWRAINSRFNFAAGVVPMNSSQ